MTRFEMISRTTLMLGLLGGTQAMADVTAQDVWNNWKEQMDVYGDSGVTIGNETMSGGTLTVESLTIDMQDPEASVHSEMGPIVFTEQGDGTVSVDMPDSYPLVIDMPREDVTISLTVSMVNDRMIVSGTPEAMSYDMSVDRYEITLDGLGDDFADEGTIEAGTLAMNAVEGTYLVRTDNLRRMDYALNVGSVEMALDLREKGGDGVITFSGDMAALVAAAKIAMPLDFDPEAPETMFVNGFSVEGGYSIGASNYAFDFNADGETAQGTATVGSAGIELAMNADGMRYAGQSTDVAIQAMIPSEIPFPIEASLAEYGLNFAMPLSQSDEPRDFAAGIALRDLSVSDGIWSLFDPGSVLPRDPATVVLDLTGKANLFFDLMDPEQQMAAEMADVPGELHEMTLNDLTLRVAGAEVTGDGAFTFDNSDLTTFDGLPRPEGEINLQINGINGLIDKLVQMGLIPEDQAMMPRMMLGMFATPVGDDQLTSKIEINDQGHILANGQRLQ